MVRFICFFCFAAACCFVMPVSAAEKVVVVPLFHSPIQTGCPAGLTDCSDQCVATNFDPNNCGDCLTKCSEDEYCANGICAKKCSQDCDDKNPCTDDTYDPATRKCVYTNNTASCDDGDACTTADTCSTGTCMGGTPLTCDDANVCTDDSCDAASGCLHTSNTAPCDDSNVCTNPDTCNAGTCDGTPVAPGETLCDDNDPSTIFTYCDGQGNCLPL